MEGMNARELSCSQEGSAGSNVLSLQTLSVSGKRTVSYFRSEYFKISIYLTTLTFYTSTVTNTKISPLFASA
jgi:hypothetical protein